LDHYFNPCPVNVVGELYISGDSLAMGYLNNAELTAEKFLENPFASASTSAPSPTATNYYPSSPLLYRTGDQARWLADGNVEFLGRIDTQVKIRGYRIELAEIENQLLKHKRIRETVVMAKEAKGIKGSGFKEGERYLCAYFVPNRVDVPQQQPEPPGPAEHPPGEKPSISTELREYLSGSLPDYMIPSYFVEIEKIPMTPNGKIDARALPEPQIRTVQKYIAPRNAMEEKLAEIWKQVLQLDEVGINDNFFESGGNSMKIISVTNLINEAFDVNIPVVKLFRFTTIRAIGQLLANEETKVRDRDKELMRAKQDRANLLKRRRGTKDE
jgi:acyl carrier protein